MSGPRLIPASFVEFYQSPCRVKTGPERNFLGRCGKRHVVHEFLILVRPHPIGAEPLYHMIERLSTDRMWADEYEEFVHNVSFATAAEEISFRAGLDATRRLVELYERRGD